MTKRSSGSTHKELIDNLQANGVIKNPRVHQALRTVDRAHFAKKNPYMDSPQTIGYGVNISAPHMHAHALELLSGHMKEGSRALDIGSGSGFLTACMAVMGGRTGKAVGIDHMDQLVTISITNVHEDPHLGAMIDDGRLELVVGEGRSGYQPASPYDAIHVGAAVPEIPQSLIDQLKLGGRLVLPVGPRGKSQVLMLVDKLPDGTVKQEELMGVMYGSLSSMEDQWPKSRGK